jgi:hypothetical protein
MAGASFEARRSMTIISSVVVDGALRIDPACALGTAVSLDVDAARDASVTRAGKNRR